MRSWKRQWAGIFWRKIVTFPKEKLLSINICLGCCSGCLKFKTFSRDFERNKIQNPHVLNGRGRIQVVTGNKP